MELNCECDLWPHFVPHCSAANAFFRFYAFTKEVKVIQFVVFSLYPIQIVWFNFHHLVLSLHGQFIWSLVCVFVVKFNHRLTVNYVQKRLFATNLSAMPMQCNASCAYIRLHRIRNEILAEWTMNHACTHGQCVLQFVFFYNITKCLNCVSVCVWCCKSLLYLSLHVDGAIKMTKNYKIGAPIKIL